MGKKKSLGYNPLAYSMLGHASFDFINVSQAESENQQEEEKSESDSPSKVTVSYYLEEKLVNKIRELAHKRELSYSAFVGGLLKQSIKEHIK